MTAFLRHIGKVSVAMNSTDVRDKTAPGWGGKKRRFVGQVARKAVSSSTPASVTFASRSSSETNLTTYTFSAVALGSGTKKIIGVVGGGVGTALDGHRSGSLIRVR